ncbi:MAG: potassium channel protein [Phycisphaerales bacterium]|nr:potassium channel protein [Phycisphaerales bacterium]
MSSFPVISGRGSPTTATDLKRRVVYSVLLLVLVVVVGAAGFDWLGGDKVDFWPDGLWDTFNIISTVGSLPDLRPVEQGWAMFVIIVGLSSFLYLYGNLLTLLFSGEVMRVFERRKMERLIESLSNHVVLCGFGNTGRVIAAQLAGKNVPFVVVDQKEEAVDDAAEKGYMSMLGDCTQDAVLSEAGLERSRALVATLDCDASNVFVTLTARGLNPKLHIVARAEEETTISKLERAGANRVAVPGRIAAMQMSHMLLKPAVTDFIIDAMRGTEFEMRQLAAADFPWMVGKTLVELNLPREHQIIVIARYHAPEGGQRAAYTFNPSPDVRLSEDDTLVVVCQPEAYERLVKPDAS